MGTNESFFNCNIFFKILFYMLYKVTSARFYKLVELFYVYFIKKYNLFIQLSYSLLFYNM